MSTHERQKSSVFSARRVQLLPDFEEVVVDESDNVKAIGDDLGVWEETTCDPAVGFGEVHDDDSHLKLVKKPLKRALERKFGAPEEDIVNPVFGKVAEGGGVSFLTGKEVLVDAKDPWAGIVLHLREFVLKEVVIAAFDSGLSDRELL